MKGIPSTTRAIIFDLDGVLVDTAKLHYKAWKQLADEIAIPFDEAANEGLKGVSRMDSLKILLGGRKHFPSEEMVELTERKNQYYLKYVETLSQKDLLPGALDILAIVRYKGLKTALASASRNAKNIINRVGILSFFDVVVDGNDIVNGKPDPELFLKTSEYLEIVPSHCVVIEDAAVGIQAAKRAGMYAIGIGKPEILEEADMVIRHLDELKDKFHSDN